MPCASSHAALAGCARPLRGLTRTLLTSSTPSASPLPVSRSVTLNGDALGLTDNQFRRYSWDVTKRLRAAGEQNTISIHLSSPVQYAQRQASAYPYPVNHAKFLNGFDNANFIRKRPSDFGWDWGPAVGPVGIWRNISLLGYAHDTRVDSPRCSCGVFGASGCWLADCAAANP